MGRGQAALVVLAALPSNPAEVELGVAEEPLGKLRRATPQPAEMAVLMVERAEQEGQGIAVVSGRSQQTLVEMVLLVQFDSSGPEQLVNSHQLALAILNFQEQT